MAGAIESIGEQTAGARRVLTFLETSQDAKDETVKLKTSVDRLSLVSGGSLPGVYHLIRAVYSSLHDLRDDLETLRQLAALSKDSAEISTARTYISDAEVPSADFPNLAVDRETLLTGLSPSRLTRSRGRG